MLNEGWDVLNLFDIVRLYETRQASGKAGTVGSYTIKEAQLIGRGARYCPFSENEEQAIDRRKYDYDISNQKRILETLLYHSFDDSRYINELRQALKETGLLPEKPIKIRYKVKETFKSNQLYKEGVIFSNKRILKSRAHIKGIENKISDTVVTKKIASGYGKLYSLFEDTTIENKKRDKHIYRVYIKDVPLNILYFAISNFESLSFNKLKNHFPNLLSTKEFLCSDNYAGSVILQIESIFAKLKPMHYYEATMKALDFVSKHVMSIKAEYEGTKEFYEKRICETVKDKIIYIEKLQKDSVGVSQAETSEDNALDLSHCDWYIFNDNFGTSEEKAFVKYFSTLLSDLYKKYEKIYLIRNERVPDLAIYDFETGQRFEPDFLLVMQKHGKDGFDQQQIFIEPKGDHLLDKDKWKEDFLFRLESESLPVKKYVDNNRYKIIGVPFFNKKHRIKEFNSAMNNIK